MVAGEWGLVRGVCVSSNTRSQAVCCDAGAAFSGKVVMNWGRKDRPHANARPARQTPCGVRSPGGYAHARLGDDAVRSGHC